MISLTDKEKQAKQKVCHTCKKKFCADENEKKYQKVRDHCHYIRKFRAAAHSIFNLRYKVLGKTATYKLKFIDSFRFTSTLLSSQVDNLFEINKEECKACMNGENIESGCDFIGLKNNNSRYKCKECEKYG